MNEIPSQQTGRCLCGGVRYRLVGELPGVVVAPIAASSFELLTGAGLLKSYRATPGKERLFCSRCGSPLFSRRDDAPYQLRLRVCTLSDTRKARIASHAHVASKVEWCVIGDDAPRHAGPKPS